jgi:hypothetical protein
MLLLLQQALGCRYQQLLRTRGTEAVGSVGEIALRKIGYGDAVLFLEARILSQLQHFFGREETNEGVA